MLIRNARLWPHPAFPPGSPGAEDIPVTDVKVCDGRVADCAPGLRPSPGEEEVDAAGHALLPGLHDHHVHLRALAAARASVPVGPPQVRTPGELAQALKTADALAGPGEWLRCVGYHESVAGLLDRWILDRMVPSRPVRVQHRTGKLWMLNSAAADQAGLDDCELAGVERDSAGRPTGRLWRMDRWLAARVPAAGAPAARASLAQVSAGAAALGITGFTDATPGATGRDIASLAAAVRDGSVVQRVHAMAPARSCFPPDAAITPGPVKLLLDDDTLPSLDELLARVRRAHAENLPVAVHCVTAVQLALTLAALDGAGRLPGDRIEHGSVIPAEAIPELRGLTIVTQPHFIAERGEQYAADVDAADLPDLWRLRSLIDAGVAVAAGTDAPFGGGDPWQAMRSAVSRPAVFRTSEAVSPARALLLFLGEAAAPAAARRVQPGQAADLVLLRVTPAEALRSLASDLVVATFVGGRRVYERGR